MSRAWVCPSMRAVALALGTRYVLGIDAGEALSSQFIVITIVVGQAGHGRVVGVNHTIFQLIAVSEAAHARSSPGASTGTLGMTGQSIATSKFPVAFGTHMGLLASMEFPMTLQIVKPTKAHLTVGADIWLLLAMCQQVTLKIVVTRKFRVAVWTFVFFGSR